MNFKGLQISVCKPFLWAGFDLIATWTFLRPRILQAVLEKWGYEVVAVADGVAAQAAMQADDAPQLVVLDWMMPSLDGPSLCRNLRERMPHKPLYLILLTAKGEKGDMVQGLEAGADDYVSKPYDNAEMQARVNVGRRMVMLQNELRESVKLQGILEMAGAVCHELNQPLQGVLGYSELLSMEMGKDDLNYATIEKMKMEIERIGELTRKIMKIFRYRSKNYTDGSRILDIDLASRPTWQ